MWGNAIAGFDKHKYSGGCLHITRLADVDTKILSQMVKRAFESNGTTC